MTAKIKSSQDTDERKPKKGRCLLSLVVILVLLSVFFVVSWVGSWGHSPTYDEPLHIVGAWIQVHHDDFRCNPEDPALWKYWAAGTSDSDLKWFNASPLWERILRPGPQTGFTEMTVYESGTDVDGLFKAAHARMALLGVVLGAMIAWWAWKLGGPVAGIVSAAFFCLDPNFLAHSPLVKNDVPMTLVFLIFAALVWRIGEKVTALRWAGLAIVVGAAMTTKFSGVVAGPLLAFSLLVRALMNSPWPVGKTLIKTRGARLALAAGIVVSCGIVAYLFIWGCYGFRYGPSPDAKEQFATEELAAGVRRLEAIKAHGAAADTSGDLVDQWLREQQPSTTDRLFEWAFDHRVLPQAWLYGFYYTWGRSLIRAGFLCGEYLLTGWWYYFPAAFAFKTPIATLLALLLACVGWIVLRRGRDQLTNSGWTWIAGLIVPVVYLLAAASGSLNLGLRHALPIYPYLFIFIGVMAAGAWKRKPKIFGPVIVVLLLSLSAETFAAYPDLISFFNVAAGGERGGLRLLSDSNLDWGQDLPALADWQKLHSDRQIYLCYFGHADPRHYGLHYVNVEGSDAPDDEKPDSRQPVLAVSATDLQGVYLPADEREYWSQFLREKPIAVLGGSIYIFDDVAGRLPPPRKSHKS